MATEITLYDVERYHLLRAKQAEKMALAINESKQAGKMALAIDKCSVISDSVYVYFHLLQWIEAKTEADEIWLKKGYQEAMMQAYGIFDNA